LNVACGLLQLYQITTETAISGRQAIEMVQRNQYDIVFMDHRMPEMDGVETTQRIRGLGITVPIIALTASAIIGAREMMLAAGMDDYLSKPVIKSELNYMLRKWIPAEKILKPLEEMASPDGSDDERHKIFWEKIEQIEGLSVLTGLDRVDGQRDVYKKTLKLMIPEIEKSDNNLSMFLAADDMDNFRIEVHGLKGALANIGAMKLSAKASDLEAASQKMDAHFCVSGMPSLLDGLANLNFSLKEAFLVINHSGGEIDIPPELPPIFEKMMDAFEKMDLVLIDREVENLKALNAEGALKEEIEHITDMVMMMDYESAAEEMHKLLKDA
jgi:CheY-like chemotaxis protein/HPt (histidine-containing phosphotransfer) domain-containing protein